MTIRVLVMRIGSAEYRTIEPTLDNLTEIIGGWIEDVPYIGGHAYCDEEGKIKGLPVNNIATAMAHDLGWPKGDYLCGTVVFLGYGENGDEGDVPDNVSDWLKGSHLGLEES